MSDPAPAPGSPAPLAGRPDLEAQRRRRRLLRRWDHAFWWLTGAAGAAFLVLLGALALLLLADGLPALRLSGPGFFVSSNWDPTTSSFGDLFALEGTIVTSLLALLLAVPVALGVAYFIAEVAPRRVRGALAYVVDLSAAVPSIVYGIWAFYALRPFLAQDVEPGLKGLTSGGFPFASTSVPNGLDLLSASVILAIMILPTVASVSREALLAVPALSRESFLSLGATRWEATKLALRGPARPGIFAGIMLGLGRAVGETMAVLIMSGDVPQTTSSLLAPGTTLSAWIANDFTAALPGTSEKSALYALGFVLLILCVGVNLLARFVVRVGSRASAHRRPDPHLKSLTHRSVTASGAPSSALPAWLRAARAASVRVRRRRLLVDRGMKLLALLCIALAFAPLIGLVSTAAELGGADVLRPSFYTALPPIAPPPGQPGAAGGIGPAIQGTLLMLGIASLLAIPLGIFAAVFVHEHARGARLPRWLRPLPRLINFFAEVMTGVPTLLIGVFAFTLLYALSRYYAQGALAGGVALGLVMLPIVIRTAIAALASVPTTVREAGLALGFPRNRVALRISLGSARSALTSGGLLAVSRAAGDTAALLFTAGYAEFYANGLTGPIASLPTFIFNNYDSPATNMQAAAWGATLVLLALMLGLQLLARGLTQLSRRRAKSGVAA